VPISQDRPWGRMVHEGAPVENRRAERTRKRLACSLLSENARTAGLILDLSSTGIFVQTSAQFETGDAVGVEFEPPGSFDTLRLEGRVARRKTAPARLKSIVPAGVGIEIERAPEEFYALVAELQGVVGGRARPKRGSRPAPEPHREPEAQPESRSDPKPSTRRTSGAKGTSNPKPSAKRTSDAKGTPDPKPAQARAAPSVDARGERKPVLRRLRKRFRVEVHEIEGKGARLVVVEAINVAAAGRRALEEVGEGWKVAGCEVE